MVWPLTPSDSVYCPAPSAFEWLAELPNKWTTRYPLIHVVIPPSWLNNSNDMSASLQWYHNEHHHAAWDNASTAAPQPFQLPSLIDARFCSFGYTFILEAVTGYIVALLSFGCFVALVYHSRYHVHRKLLFFLLFAVGIVRGLFGHLGANRIATVNTFLDTAPIMTWFFDNTIPLNALGDLLTSYIDFLLTFFWLQFVAPQWSDGKWGTFVPLFLSVSVALVGVITFVRDYHDIYDLHDYNNGNVYYRTIGYLSALLLFSSVLHSVVVGLLLKQLLTHQGYVKELSPTMRKHMMVVGIIGFCSVICGVMRGVVLFGHILQTPLFLEGLFSFDNPYFTTVYFVGFMNFPCFVISLSFFALSMELMKHVDVEDEARGDGTYSVSSDGHGVRITLLSYGPRKDSAINLNGSVTSDPRTPVAARVAPPPSAQFLKDSPKKLTSSVSASAEGSLSTLHGADKENDDNSRRQLESETSGRLGSASNRSSAAMFAGRGHPMNRSGGFGSKREL